MSTKTTILLSNVSAEASPGSTTFTFSNKKKGAGYHKRYGGLHTATYSLDNFSGTIKLQATLELYPGDNDWFDIDGTELGGDSSFWTSTRVINFTGNFVWIRAGYNVQNGTISEIRYNY